MSFWDVAFLPSRGSFPPHFLKKVNKTDVLQPSGCIGCKNQIDKNRITKRE